MAGVQDGCEECEITAQKLPRAEGMAQAFVQWYAMTSRSARAKRELKLPYPTDKK